MAMYVYFDKNGVLQEIVQDKSVRVGDYKANRIYMYFDTSATISDVWFIMQSPDGVLSTEVSIKDNQIDLSIPYQKNRDLHFFQDYQTYHFYYYDLDSVEVQYSGLAYATVRANVDNALYAQGLITFNVESNVIKLDNGITQSQYDYLLVTYSKTKELTEELQAKVNELEANLNAEIERATNEETTLNTKISNEITRAQQVESSINQALNAHIDNKENPHSVTKEQIGLSNVDNTSDLDKPMSTATKDYIDTKVSGAMVYRGSVQKFSDLPTDAQNGDVYNVVEAYLTYPPNTNYAWNGSSWDPLGGSLADVYAKLNEKVDLSTMQLINGQKTFVEPLNMQKGSNKVTVNYGYIKYNDLIFVFPKIAGNLVVEDQVLMKPSTPVEFSLIGIEPTGSGTQVSVKLGSNLSYNSTTKTLNASGGGSKLPGYIQFPTGDIESASYTKGVYEYLAVFEMFDTLDGTKLKEGEMTFMLPIKAGNYLAVDLDSDNKTLKVALDDTKIDKTPTKDSTNLITSGAVYNIPKPVIISFEYADSIILTDEQIAQIKNNDIVVLKITDTSVSETNICYKMYNDNTYYVFIGKQTEDVVGTICYVVVNTTTKTAQWNSYTLLSQEDFSDDFSYASGQMYLSNAIKTAINNSLKLESNLPEEFKLVGINVKNYQENITLGDNLSYDAVTKKLNASGGGVPVLLEELPTEVADNTPKVFYCKNELYIVQEPSTGETWVLNESPNAPSANIDVNIDFKSNNENFKSIYIPRLPQFARDGITYYKTDSNAVIAFKSNTSSWTSDAYRTITFEEAVTDSNLLTWLQANGTKQ